MSNDILMFSEIDGVLTRMINGFSIDWLTDECATTTHFHAVVYMHNLYANANNKYESYRLFDL